MFDNITKLQQKQSNQLINESERNDTISSSIPNFSVFNKSFQQATTFDSGYAIPIISQICYPGDIYKIDTNTIIRLSALASTPLMNMNYDINFFFIPFNQIDKEFNNLMGENNDYGFSDTNIGFPTLEYDAAFRYNESDLANYFNIPINVDYSQKGSGSQNNKINLYPFLAYGKVWNEWYRDQNLQSSIDITTCFNVDRKKLVSTYKGSMTFYESIIYGKGLAPTSKLPSYFTTNLPYQQKGEPIKINYDFSQAKVVGNVIDDNAGTNRFQPRIYTQSGSLSNNNVLSTSNGNLWLRNNPSLSDVGNGYMSLKLADNTKIIGDISPTINDLRNSIVYQHLLENWALCGSRYVEQLKSIWGIEIDPTKINRTELIGGFNETLQYNNLVQTSATSSNSQLGKIATNLFNGFGNPRVEYACSQHGIIIGIITLRTKINNGGQGLPKFFSYENYLDFFNPMFNGIGEQPTLNKELFWNSANPDKNNMTFGFNEPFLDTKYNIDNANGFFSLNSNTSLFPMFLFGEKYTDTPILSSEWIKYNPNIIGNTLYNVSDDNKEFYHQFIALFDFSIEYTTKQPLFNSPRVYGI